MEEESGTKRSFANMLNENIKAYAPTRYKKHPKKTSSAWSKMDGKKKKKDGGGSGGYNVGTY